MPLLKQRPNTSVCGRTKTLDKLTEQHAKQENMTLSELKEGIRGIYSSEEQFFTIDFKLR